MGWRCLRFLRHDNESMERCPPRSKFFGKCLGGSLCTRVGGWPRCEELAFGEEVSLIEKEFPEMFFSFCFLFF